MSEGGSNIIGVRDVFEAIAAFRGEVAASTQALRDDIGAARQEQARQAMESAKEIAYIKGKMDGWIGAMRWLGPTGLAALVIGVLIMAGVIPMPTVP